MKNLKSTKKRKTTKLKFLIIVNTALILFNLALLLSTKIKWHFFRGRLDAALIKIKKSKFFPTRSEQLKSDDSVEEIKRKIFEKEVLRFAVIGDLHIGQSLDVNWHLKSNIELLEKALRLSKEKGAEFVVLLGDLTDMGKKDEFKQLKEILDSANLTYFTTLGDHDNNSREVDYYKNLFGVPNTYGKIEFPLKKLEKFKNPVIQKNALLYFIDLSYEIDYDYSSLGEAQTRWLREELEANRGDTNQIILVFSGGRSFSVPAADKNRLETFLCELEVSGFFFGDTHRTTFSNIECYLGCSEDIKRENIVVPALGPGTISIINPEHTASFLLMHYFQDKRFEVEKIPIEESF